MDYGKYIIVKIGASEHAIMFSSLITHSDLLESFNKDSIISAGMFVVGAEKSKDDDKDIGVSVFGESVTLNKEVRKGKDEELIKRVLRMVWLG